MTTPAVPPEAVNAAHQAIWDRHDTKQTLLSQNAARDIATAVVAALDLDGRDRETAAKALDEAAWATGHLSAHNSVCRFPDVECECGVMEMRAVVNVWLRSRAAELRKEAGQ